MANVTVGSAWTTTLKVAVSVSPQRLVVTVTCAVPKLSFHWMSTWSVPCPATTLPISGGSMDHWTSSPSRATLVVSWYPAIWFSQADSSIKPVGMAGASLLNTKKEEALQFGGASAVANTVSMWLGLRALQVAVTLGPVLLVREPVPPVFQK